LRREAEIRRCSARRARRLAARRRVAGGLLPRSAPPGPLKLTIKKPEGIVAARADLLRDREADGVGRLEAPDRQ
jgi:hypothetical protein